MYEAHQETIDMLSDKLAEAQDKVKYLEEQLVGVTGRLQDNTKLIEQMREALELVLEGAIHDFHYVCQHRDNCLCWGCQKARIKAALEAAERGE